MEKIVIMGASGHGRVVADIARACGYSEVIFLDDADVPLASGKGADYIHYREDSDFIVAIGNSKIRERVQKELTDGGCRMATLVHPQAVIGSNVTLGLGTVIMPGAVINAGATIGEGVIINTSSSVDHDCNIGDYCHVSVGAHVAGTVHVNSHTWIGAGATVSNNLNICKNCMIGAGAVVVKDIVEAGTYVGVPARKIEKD